MLPSGSLACSDGSHPGELAEHPWLGTAKKPSANRVLEADTLGASSLAKAELVPGRAAKQPWLGTVHLPNTPRAWLGTNSGSSLLQLQAQLLLLLQKHSLRAEE